MVHVPTSAGEVRGLTRTDSDADVYALETQFARMMNHQDILTEGTVDRIEKSETVVHRPSADEDLGAGDDFAIAGDGVSQPVISSSVSVGMGRVRERLERFWRREKVETKKQRYEIPTQARRPPPHSGPPPHRERSRSESQSQRARCPRESRCSASALKTWPRRGGGPRCSSC